jgi:hypothetical protein
MDIPHHAQLGPDPEPVRVCPEPPGTRRIRVRGPVPANRFRITTTSGDGELLTRIRALTDERVAAHR